jgi:hypothetical protein
MQRKGLSRAAGTLTFWPDQSKGVVNGAAVAFCGERGRPTQADYRRLSAMWTSIVATVEKCPGPPRKVLVVGLWSIYGFMEFIPAPAWPELDRLAMNSPNPTSRPQSPRAWSEPHLRIARFPSKWITSGLCVIQQRSGRAHRRPGCTGGQCTRGCVRDRVGLANGGNIAPTTRRCCQSMAASACRMISRIVFSRP